MDGSEEGLAVEANEADCEGSTGKLYLGTTSEMQLLRVGTEVERLRVVMCNKAQAGSIWYYDGTQSEVVGSNGSDDKTAAVGREDRAATAERIGSRACRSGDDKTVGSIGGNKIVVDIEVGT